MAAAYGKPNITHLENVQLKINKPKRSSYLHGELAVLGPGKRIDKEAKHTARQT